MASRKTYGPVIRENRERLGLTQRELGDAIGVTDGYVAHLEREFKLPSVNACMAMGSVFGWSDDEQAAFLEAVDEARALSTQKRIRSRGIAVRGALLGRRAGTRGEDKPKKLSAAQISRDLAADPKLADAYRNLTRTLADPSLRETILRTLETFAQRVADAPPARKSRAR